jgi:hypothetical protein
VKWGVGRYLYRQPGQWVEWDAQKRRFARPPGLPAAPAQETPRPPAPAQPPELPTNGTQLLQTLRKWERRLMEKGACKLDDFVAAVKAEAIKGGMLGEQGKLTGVDAIHIPAILLGAERMGKEWLARVEEPAA